MKIWLYEAAPRLLNGMSDNAGAKALKFLKQLGVEVHLDTRIDDYDGDKVTLSDGSSLFAKNLIWTAGVSGRQTDGIEERLYTRGKRLSVDKYNRLKGQDNVFVIGDACLIEEDEYYPNGHPQVAQVAIQQANNLAQNLQTTRPWKEFKYQDKGSLATIGRNMAVADLPGFSFSGVFAWFLWLFVHLMAIVGVKNRFFIFVNWAQSYFSRDQSLRILISPYKKR
jgi:NADH dehydrogenase